MNVVFSYYRQPVGNKKSNERAVAMRVVKDAQERRNEILDVAERLFCTKGFDNTSTNDILNEIGIARGTLYYHFKSKEDILDAMIERLTKEVLHRAKVIAHDADIPVMERLVRAIMALNLDNELGNMVMEQVHRPQNALLHQKMQKSLLSGVNPMITALVKEGIAQGLFHTDYPEGAVEMTMVYSNIAFDGLEELTKEETYRKVIAFSYNVERLLGVKEGSLLASMKAIFKL